MTFFSCNAIVTFILNKKKQKTKNPIITNLDRLISVK